METQNGDRHVATYDVTHGVAPEQPAAPVRETKPDASQIARRLGIVSAVLGVLSVSVIANAFAFWFFLPKMVVRAAIFVAVATVPQWIIDPIAARAETVAGIASTDKKPKRGFRNLGAWVGALERPLLLGALVGGFAEFIAGWYVLKGIAGYKLGLDDDRLVERRLFQLFLVNNALSFAGVAVSWLVWQLLNLWTQ